ncbi:aspartic peptidase [Chloropicon primus]|uniref:Aspartic peptidase n=1 Tax=Chloropicon primus TaxID=1764295 RepID=A0A5B8MYC1_9CHLO|nr:aspartic peptidase [Chloropicon primus]|mmetsp:Transcript_2726/g.7485  ORF Transcript_2726/g.7485 Transcript_2726/m.7485 type:complete len:536 (+) Transcript_2726:138-1745(+)|eukprot:QDZ24592.1 aspartic peptidase [Chloropicon primus]
MMMAPSSSTWSSSSAVVSRRTAVLSLSLVAVVVVLLASVLPARATKIPLKLVGAGELGQGALSAVVDRPHRAQERGRVLRGQGGFHHRSRSGGSTTLYTIADIAKDAVGSLAAASEGQKADAVKAPPPPRPASRLVGSVESTGYYAMELPLGTPPQTFHVIVDTGSTIAYVPCSFCGDKCGLHASAPFAPQASSTASFINCMSATCATFCGSRRCNCRSSFEFLRDISLPMMSVCSYARRYQEQSSSTGLLLTDVLRLGPGVGDHRFGFGCETEETGMIFNQRADGVIGFGNNPSSIINQLVAQGAMENTFSICMGGFRGGGALFLGDESLPPTSGDQRMRYAQVHTRRENPEFYAVSVRGMKLGSSKVNVPSRVYDHGYGAVVDTGTTFLYLPDAAYKSFEQLLLASMDKHWDKIRRTRSPDSRYPNDLCYGPLHHKTSGEGERDDLLDIFPDLTIDMAASDPAVEKITLTFPPENYLFKMSGGAHGYCVGVYNNRDDGVLLGAVLMKNYLVNFDLRNNRIGFAPHDCDALNKE